MHISFYKISKTCYINIVQYFSMIFCIITAMDKMSSYTEFNSYSSSRNWNIPKSQNWYGQNVPSDKLRVKEITLSKGIRGEEGYVLTVAVTSCTNLQMTDWDDIKNCKLYWPKIYEKPENYAMFIYFMRSRNIISSLKFSARDNITKITKS